jgi:hypothetical protein
MIHSNQSLATKILDLARWAPSGDNAQPWTFRINDDRGFEIYIYHQKDNVYEYNDGEPSLISAGTLLQNIEIAAQSFGKKAIWNYLGYRAGNYVIEVELTDSTDPAAPELLSQITKRSVDRRPYSTKPLLAAQKSLLSDAVGSEFSVDWFESFRQRWKIASLTQMATDIRLRIPETFELHNRIVDWEKRESPDAIPAQALGLDWLTLKLMRWSLAKRSRTEFANAMGSPFFASLQMDLVPGLLSASYFAFRVVSRPSDADAAVIQLLNIGRAVQRFWLTATKLGLVLQPCLAVLAFAQYGAARTPFTSMDRARASAAKLALKSEDILGDRSHVVFLGRIGSPRSPLTSRSVRLPVEAFTSSRK